MKKYIKVFGVCAIALSVIACQKNESSDLEMFDEVVNSEMESQDIQSHESDEVHNQCST
jgi:hypothetical protein